MKYREENGRRYHGYKDGSYLLPNDETEQNRLDLVSPTLQWLPLHISHIENQNHHVFTMVNKGRGGGLYRAPIDKPARVLDVGTGTGIWVMDFGEYAIPYTLYPPRPRLSMLTQAKRTQRIPHHRHRPLSHPTNMGNTQCRVPRRRRRRRVDRAKVRLHPHSHARGRGQRLAGAFAKSL